MYQIMWKRILVGLVGIPAMIYVFYLGGFVLVLGITLLTAVGLLEFNNIARKSGRSSLLPFMLLFGIIFPYLYQYNDDITAATILFFLLVAAVYYLLRYPSYSPLDLAYSYLGFFYIVLGFGHLLKLRAMTDGFWLVLYVFIIVWSTDTGAYFVGTFLGRHRLAPAISPKKTWEGLLGGVACSIITVYILLQFIDFPFNNALLWLTPFISLAGQFGDLFESTLKRFAGIKDSGQIIPGHGGVLDRFDSTLWAAPVTFYLVSYLERLF